MTVLGVLRWLGWRGLLALVLLAALGVQTVRLNVVTGQKDAAEGRYAREVLDAANARIARAAAVAAWEHERAQSIARIADAYEKGKLYAQDAGKAVAAELRAGTLRLRREWLACEGRAAAVPGAAAGAGERDAATEDRADLAGAAVRAGAEADAQLRACQAILEEDRRLMPGQ